MVDNDTKKSIVDSSASISHHKHWWLLLGVLTLLAFWTRFHNVSEPDHVCWDETHFGKMSGWYINRTFFFDVHPPLGKMLIALSGYLTGYDAKFPFNNPGEKYEGANYEGMRMFCAFMGAMIVPFSYVIVWEMTRSLVASTLAASFILLDVGILTISRYIILDPILFFFMMASMMGSCKLSSSRESSFSVQWWFWLLFTGTMLACCITVKFVGLFVVLYVGLQTVADLWSEYGDMSKPVVETLKHFLARVVGLIILPAFIYVCIFYAHLTVLNTSGPGDMQFSPEFQSSLLGNRNQDLFMAREVAYAAVVTLKNADGVGNFLHSHDHVYPAGAGAPQQQITTYFNRDLHNNFLMKKHNQNPIPGDVGPVEYVRHGDLIRLEHVVTRKNLHSHQEASAITRKHFQVTGYGVNGTGDSNDVWRLHIVGGYKGEVLTVVNRHFRLIHNVLECALSTTKGVKLPEWGFNQDEVTCNPNTRDKHAIWKVHGNTHEKLPSVSFANFAPNFLSKFIEVHRVMIQSNAAMKPKEGDDVSRPWQWPFNHKGLFFSLDGHRVYLLGNPIVWWGNLVFLATFVGVYVSTSVKLQRGQPDPPHVRERKHRMTNACGWLFLGWLLHYVPFWGMQRILYYHHYFPALLFSTMLTGKWGAQR